MKFRDFVDDIKAETEARFEVETEIFRKRTVNDDLKTGLLIRTGSEVNPVIPLDALYEAELNGAARENIMDMIGDMMRMTPPGLEDLRDPLRNIDKNLHLRVVDRSTNGAFLDGLVSFPGPGSYVLVPYIRIGEMMTRVTKELAGDWDVAPGELYEMAARNEACEARLYAMGGSGTGLSGNLMEEGELTGLMYVLTNRCGLLGASQGFIKETLEKLMLRFGCGFYLLPSSIHEMILIPFSAGPVNEEALRNMVSGINDAVVKREDILSCDVLKFDGELKVAARAVS